MLGILSRSGCTPRSRFRELPPPTDVGGSLQSEPPTSVGGGSVGELRGSQIQKLIMMWVDFGVTMINLFFSIPFR